MTDCALFELNELVEPERKPGAPREWPDSHPCAVCGGMVGPRRLLPGGGRYRPVQSRRDQPRYGEPLCVPCDDVQHAWWRATYPANYAGTPEWAALYGWTPDLTARVPLVCPSCGDRLPSVEYAVREHPIRGTGLCGAGELRLNHLLSDALHGRDPDQNDRSILAAGWRFTPDGIPVRHHNDAADAA